MKIRQFIEDFRHVTATHDTLGRSTAVAMAVGTAIVAATFIGTGAKEISELLASSPNSIHDGLAWAGELALDGALAHMTVDVVKGEMEIDSISPELNHGSEAAGQQG